MRNTKCMCYENYTRLNFHVFDLRENKVIAYISGYTVIYTFCIKHQKDLHNYKQYIHVPIRHINVLCIIFYKHRRIYMYMHWIQSSLRYFLCFSMAFHHGY